MTKLIALVDGSTYSQSVCDHAAWVARGKNASVEVVHVLGRREGVAETNLSGNIGLGARTALLEELAELDATKAKLAQKRGRAILDDAKARIEAAGVKEVSCKLRNGDLVETLLELEKDADLVIVGKRGEAADFAKLHLGSNLERVVRASKKPVLVTSRAFQPIREFDRTELVCRLIDQIPRKRDAAGHALLRFPPCRGPCVVGNTDPDLLRRGFAIAVSGLVFVERIGAQRQTKRNVCRLIRRDRDAIGPLKQN